MIRKWSILTNKYIVADESAQLGPWADVGSLLRNERNELDDEMVVPSGRSAG